MQNRGRGEGGEGGRGKGRCKGRGEGGNKMWKGCKMIVLTGSTVIPCQEECYGIAVLSDLDFNILWQSVLLKDVNDKLEPSCTKELLAKVLC